MRKGIVVYLNNFTGNLQAYRRRRRRHHRCGPLSSVKFVCVSERLRKSGDEFFTAVRLVVPLTNTNTRMEGGIFLVFMFTDFDSCAPLLLSFVWWFSLGRCVHWDHYFDTRRRTCGKDYNWSTFWTGMHRSFGVHREGRCV